MDWSLTLFYKFTLEIGLNEPTKRVLRELPFFKVKVKSLNIFSWRFHLNLSWGQLQLRPQLQKGSSGRFLLTVDLSLYRGSTAVDEIPETMFVNDNGSGLGQVWLTANNTNWIGWLLDVEQHSDLLSTSAWAVQLLNKWDCGFCVFVVFLEFVGFLVFVA